MSGTWPLVCNLYPWHLFRIKRILANLEGSRTVKKNHYSLLFIEINNTAQTEKKLITAFQYFYLIDSIFFLNLISKIFLLQLLILLQKACELLIGINERQQHNKTNILFSNISPYPLYRSLHIWVVKN